MAEQSYTMQTFIQFYKLYILKQKMII